MSWIKGRLARARTLFGRREAESRMDEEFAFHIERQTEANIGAGMDPAEARRRALLAFGGVEWHREGMRDAWRLGWLEDAAADVRFALRWLRRSPGFAVVAVLTIGLGIGATTALFSVTNALLLKPLPVHEPDRLYSIQEDRSGYVVDGFEGMQVSHARYEAYVDAAPAVVTELAAHSMTSLALRADGAARPVRGVLVSGNYFGVLGVRPHLGRLFTASDEPLVVLSHRLWQSRFGGDPDVVGRTVYLDGRPLTVVGVASRAFAGTTVGFAAELWVPYRAAVESGESVWSDTWLNPFGRLSPGVEPAQAEAALSALALQIEVDARGAEVRGSRLEPMTGMLPEARPVVAGFMGLLLGMATLVLIIAAANIGGMQLARAVRRRREVAVRLAIGAGRGRLVRQLLTESMVLFLLGGAAGLLIAWWATGLIARISFPDIGSIVLEVGPDLRVLSFGLAAAALAGLAFGLLPALRSSRPDLTASLKDGGLSGATRSGRARGLFVTAQVALAVVLLAVAGLFGRTLQTALRVDPGFDPQGVVVATFSLSTLDYDEERGRAFQAQLMERVRAMADVESASLARLPLLTGSSNSYTIAPPGESEPTTVRVNQVDTEYFRTMHIDLLAGSGFDERAGAGAERLAVVNQTLADRFWPGGSPVGKVLRMGDAEFEVVGLARNGLYRDFQEDPRPFAFLSFGESYVPRVTLHVRTRTQAHEMIERIRHEIALLEPDVALDQAAPLPELMGVQLFPQRVGAYLVGVFGVLGIVMAGLGIYGLLAFRVAERTRELGIRVALGADSGAVTRLVLRGTARVTALGVAIGIVLAVAIGRLIQGFLFGIRAHDPVTFVAVPLALIAVALLASLHPIRRAVRVDPLTSLRHE